MIAYNLIVIEGCIHDEHMVVRLGTQRFGICCFALRHLIEKANKLGLYSLLENLSDEDTRMFELLYEEFKNEI